MQKCYRWNPYSTPEMNPAVPVNPGGRTPSATATAPSTPPGGLAPSRPDGGLLDSPHSFRSPTGSMILDGQLAPQQQLPPTMAMEFIQPATPPKSSSATSRAEGDWESTSSSGNTQSEETSLTQVPSSHTPPPPPYHTAGYLSASTSMDVGQGWSQQQHNTSNAPPHYNVATMPTLDRVPSSHSHSSGSGRSTPSIVDPLAQITYLRQIKTEAHLVEALHTMRQSPFLFDAVLSTFAQSPALVMEQCLIYRGSTLVQLLERMSPLPQGLSFVSPATYVGSHATTRHNSLGAICPPPPLVPNAHVQVGHAPAAQAKKSFPMQFDASGSKMVQILHHILAGFDQLACHQVGTIALLRIYDSAPSAFRTAINQKVIDAFPSLSMDQFGNFVASHVIRHLYTPVTESVPSPAGSLPSASTPASASATEDDESLYSLQHKHRMVALMTNTKLVVQMATNKFGSHCLESWIEVSDLQSFLGLVGAIVTDSSAIRRLGYHPVGNFPLQLVLRRLAQEFPTTAATTASDGSGSPSSSQVNVMSSISPLNPFAAQLAAIPPIVSDSRFYLNIRKSIQGIDPKKKSNSKKPPQKSTTGIPSAAFGVDPEESQAM